MEDGEMYYFTDFTSPKEGVDSMLGYALTNARTGKATYYTGNLEESYMDSTASTLCMDNDIKLVVFNLSEPGNIKRAVMGEKIGTVVRRDAE